MTETSLVSKTEFQSWPTAILFCFLNWFTAQQSTIIIQKNANKTLDIKFDLDPWKAIEHGVLNKSFYNTQLCTSRNFFRLGMAISALKKLNQTLKCYASTNSTWM